MRKTQFEELAASLYQTIYPRLLFYARSLTGNHSDADDLAQETMIKVFNRLASNLQGDTIDNLNAYAYEVMRRQNIDNVRRPDPLLRRRRTLPRGELAAVTIDETFALVDPFAASHFEEVETADLVAKLTMLLGENEKKLFWMLYMEWKPREIASALGVTQNVARVRIHRLRQKLKGRLEILATSSDGETVYKFAIESGHPDYAPKAAVNLGLLRREAGDLQAAEAAWQLAIDSGHPDYAPKAAVNLGLLRREAGDLQAEPTPQ